MRLRRLMLQLKSFGEKQMEASQLVQQIAAHEVGPWVRAILEQPVPSCAARSWLTQIWKDVPSSRPCRDLLVGCSVRWVADPFEHKEGKATLLQIIREEIGRSQDAEAKIVSLVFQEVCRQPMTHLPDLQQLLWLGELCPPFLL
eukprot:Skav200507  [mRNA]  locus=scaffold450:380599:381299:- [translate_table: standard]